MPDLSYNTVSLVNGAYEQGLLDAGEDLILEKVTTNVPARVRLYRTAESRESDADRSLWTDPTIGSDLLLEVVTAATDLVAELDPLIAAPRSLYITVTNLSGAASAVEVSITGSVEDDSSGVGGFFGDHVVWKFHLVESETMEIIGELDQARGRSVQLVHNRPGGASFQIPLEDDVFAVVEPVKHGIIVYRNDIPKWSGMIWTVNETLPGGRAGVNCVGWFETLNRRRLREDVSYPRYTNPSSIITGGQIVFNNPFGTVGADNHHPGGLLTIANAQRDTWITEGINSDQMKRIISYAKGQSIGEAITALSEVEAGFDFSINPLTRVMRIKNWDEYRDQSDVAAFGFNWGPNNLASVSRQLDSSTMVNRMVAMGKFGGALVEDTESQEEFQLFEEEAQLSDVVDPNVLLGYAGGEIVLRSRPRVIYTLAPFPWTEGRTPQPFVDYDVGDKVQFTAHYPPRISIPAQGVRIFGMTVNITEEGNEKISELQVIPG